MLHIQYRDTAQLRTADLISGPHISAANAMYVYNVDLLTRNSFNINQCLLLMSSKILDMVH